MGRVARSVLLGAGLLVGSFATAAAQDSESEREQDRWNQASSLRLGAFLGYDTDPAVVDDDGPGVSSGVGFASADVSADVFLFHKQPLTKGEYPAERLFQVGLGVETFGLVQTGFSSLEPYEHGWRLFAEGDVFVCLEDDGNGGRQLCSRNKAIERVSVGLLLDGADRDLNREPFSSTLGGTLVTQLTFRQDGNCELDNLRLYYRRHDYDAREALTRREYDRDGDIKVAGADFTLYQPSRGVECYRRGPFFRLIPETSWSFNASYRYETWATRGTEFGVRRHVGNVWAQWPVAGNFSVEGMVEYARATFRNRSVIDPGVEHQDDLGVLRLAARWHRPLETRMAKRNVTDMPPSRTDQGIRKFRMPGVVQYYDLVFGFELTDYDSDVEFYDYGRGYFFFGIEISFAGVGTGGQGQPTNAGTRETETGSGSERPVVVDELPP